MEMLIFVGNILHIASENMTRSEEQQIAPSICIQNGNSSLWPQLTLNKSCLIGVFLLCIPYLSHIVCVCVCVRVRACVHVCIWLCVASVS